MNDTKRFYSSVFDGDDAGKQRQEYASKSAVRDNYTVVSAALHYEDMTGQPCPPDIAPAYEPLP